MTPTTGATIQARQLTKRYRPVVAIDGLTFDVVPGRVTGFLGPNGAGKSTTMRLILGLDAPTAGTATVGGVAYRRLRRPLFQVGAMLESSAVHPGRSARAHLLALAQSNGIGRRPHRRHGRPEPPGRPVAPGARTRRRGGTVVIAPPVHTPRYPRRAER